MDTNRQWLQGELEQIREAEDAERRPEALEADAAAAVTPTPPPAPAFLAFFFLRPLREEEGTGALLFPLFLPCRSHFCDG